MFGASKTKQVSSAANYIEDVFSTYLYTGTGATQTITNNIDLSTYGGLTWIKSRSAATNNCLFDTARGATKYLGSNTSTASTTDANGLTAFGTTGFTLGSGNTSGDQVNTSAATFVSWTFRKQAKFFDVVTYTGDGVDGRVISHALGSSPGVVLIKRTDTTGPWVWNDRLGNALRLNDTSASSVSNLTGGYTGYANYTSTSFTLSSYGGSIANINANGGTYVAYLFAHNAGGFGLTGTDNVISCGSYTGTGAAGNTVSLGYEPQWMLIKQSSAAGNPWRIEDVMRGMNLTTDAFLNASSSAAETTSASSVVAPTATGFVVNSTDSAYNSSGATYIYIAIRRGPMKVPTDATKVFLPSTFTGSNTVNKLISTNFTVDMTWGRARNAVVSMEDYDRLRGNTVRLSTDLTNAEVAATALYFDVSNGVNLLAGYDLNYSPLSFTNYAFQRAPSFFDEVCYTGTGSNTTQTHNLGAVPELIIVKGRSGATAWEVYSSALSNTEYLVLNTTAAKATGTTRWNSTTPTSTVFSLGTGANVNTSSATYVAYLFATCAGVSKVGSYTGTGSTQTISCGFTGGARFVLVKRTDSTGDWYVWDTARGMVSGTDPSLLLNSEAAEVNANSVYTTTGGFQIVSTAAGINASGGSYIYLAVA